MIVRAEAEKDFAAIRAVQEKAFLRVKEADLVDRLRVDGATVVSLVAVKGEMVVGHIVLSRMVAPFRALGLGPIAVLPEFQRTGIGTRLVNEALAEARGGEWEGVFVLGAPAYYRRFGFDPRDAAGFSSPYAGPHFMVATLRQGSLPMRTGEIAYPVAFSALGC